MEEKKLLNQSSPVYAIDLTKNKNSQEKWIEQQKKLSRNIRYGLISLKTEKLIKIMSEKYQLNSSEKLGSLSVLVRNFVIGELTEEKLKKEIFQRFQFNNSKNDSFLKDFKKTVEEIKKIGIAAVKEDLVVFKFKELLEKFPEIKKQEIGVQLIFFPGEQQGKEPYIENWITDYRLRKNDQQKTSILNVSDYLYNGENTRPLNIQEKEELSVVLNAFDENKTVYYNTLFEKIDFEIIKLLEKNKKLDSKFNVIKFESKPYHDTDIKTEIAFKPKPITKIKIPKVQNKEKAVQQNVLNLNKYI